MKFEFLWLFKVMSEAKVFVKNKKVNKINNKDDNIHKSKAQ